MRGLFSLVALLVVLGAVALLARNALRTPITGLPTPAVATGASAARGSTLAPAPGPAAQARQLEDQVRQAIDAAAARSQRERDAAEQN